MYKFSKASKKELEGVAPSLQDFANELIRVTNIDFAVHDGIRTEEEQREYVSKGVSQTMNSKHLPQEDGYGHALDLVPYVNGKMRWEWTPIYKLMSQAQAVALDHNLELRWGGVWDRAFLELGENLEAEVESYAKRIRSRGQKVFLDGPHLELVS